MTETNAPAFRPINPGRAEMIKTYHFHGYLKPTREITSPLDCFSRAREITLNWMQEKYPDPLPQAMREGCAYRVEEHGQVITTESLEQKYWAMRNEMPDSGIGENAVPVPGRQWITEVVLARENTDDVRVSITVYCRNLPMAQGKEIHLLRPRIVKDLAVTGMLWTDGRQTTLGPWHVNTPKEVEKLFQFAISPERKLPLVICVERTAPRISTGFNHEVFAADAVGAAHWAVLDHEQIAVWNLKAGTTARMEAGWVGLCYAGFDPDTPEKAKRFRIHTNPTDDIHDFTDYKGKHFGAEAFQRYLKKTLFNEIRFAPLDREFVPTLTDIRRRRLETERENATESDSSLLPLYEDEIETLKKDVEELNELLAARGREIKEKEQQIQDLNREISGLKAKITSLNRKEAARPSSTWNWKDHVPADEECTWDNLIEWADTELAGRLLLHSRARRMLKDAEYEDPILAYKALALLAGPYREMNLKGGNIEEPRKQWKEGLKSLHLKEEPSLGESKTGGNNAEEYEIVHNDKRFFLERHLKKGNSWDRRHCFRVYYCFDNSDNQVLVGGMPHHLSTDYS